MRGYRWHTFPTEDAGSDLIEVIEESTGLCMKIFIDRESTPDQRTAAAEAAISARTRAVANEQRDAVQDGE